MSLASRASLEAQRATSRLLDAGGARLAVRNISPYLFSSTKSTFQDIVKYMSGVVSTVEIVILGKAAQLARRFGLRLSDYLAVLKHDEEGREHLVFAAAPVAPGPREKFTLMGEALGGFDGNQELIADTIDELEDRLDRALRRAPRMREL